MHVTIFWVQTASDLTFNLIQVLTDNKTEEGVDPRWVIERWRCKEMTTFTPKKIITIGKGRRANEKYRQEFVYLHCPMCKIFRKASYITSAPWEK